MPAFAELGTSLPRQASSSSRHTLLAAPAGAVGAKLTADKLCQRYGDIGESSQDLFVKRNHR
jgi:hypothetical protein